MDELVVRTTVYADPADVYAFLLEFPRYAQYTDYLDRVDRLAGDGGVGSEYALRFSWWKLGYTARSAVIDVDPPTRIDWRLTKDIDAHGCWRIEPTTVTPETADARIKRPGGAGGAVTDRESGSQPAEQSRTEAETETVEGPHTESEPDVSEEPVTINACEVALEIRFDPDTASADAVDLPRLVSFGWVLERAIPLIKEEAVSVVERAVADLEGLQRPVDLEVTVDSERL
ncbi:SRPBCC family protein [Halopenitus malekzadehii]|uniref:SRPBCC family protein n=1 Tax=Halopenitus malekzadehii TaxID=1267564 RepID=UPI0015A52965|nr:SRPBCC family protein [Halopenitus malekzadehii]